MWIQDLLLLSAAATLTSSASFMDDNNQLDRLIATNRAKNDSVHREKRIIGGDEYELGTWPHLVRLKGKCPRRGGWWSYTYYYCGGAIINREWILTAAHCFKGQGIIESAMTAKYWHIKGGELKLNEFNDWWDNKQVHGKKIFLHPQYDEDNLWANDVALVKLKKQLPQDSNIQPIALPSGLDKSTWPPNYAMCYAKGWGCTQTAGELQQFPREVEFPVQTTSLCRSVYGISGDTRLCVGAIGGNTGICGGDSGGPLVCDNNGVWTLAGIASFTSANYVGYYPSVFTRITEYVSWIENTINDN